MLDALNCSRKDLIGKNDYDLWPEHAEKLREHDKKVMESSQVFKFQESIELKGKIHYYSAIKIPLVNRCNNIVGIVGNSLDITDTIELQEQLRNEKKKVEIISKAKSEFVQNMSHDIRTPIAGIISLSDATLGSFDNTALYCEKTVKQNIRDIHQASENLFNIVNDILHIVTLDSPSKQEEFLKIECFYLHNIIDKTVKLLKPALLEKGLFCHFFISSSLESQIQSSPVIIRAVLLNLLGNAIKFTDKGGIKIYADIIESQDNSRTLLRLCIEDTGKGIPKNKQKEIFEAFTRLSASYDNRYPGSGLGLYLIKNMLDKIDASISVESEINKGSRFTCIIPITLPEKEKFISISTNVIMKLENIDPIPQIDELTSNSNSVNMSQSNKTQNKLKEAKYRILLVEDSLFAGRAAAMLLTQQECEVDIATTQSEAIEYANNVIYDMILMDIGLPDGNGREATREIRKSSLPNQDTPIIALTAHIPESEHDECSSAGMDKVLYKPLTKDKIESIFNIFLSQSHEVNVVEEKYDPATAPIIDLKQAASLMASDIETAKSMLELIVADLPQNRNEFEEAYQNQEWERLQKSVHKLHGATSYCGTPRLKICCHNLESALHNKNNFSAKKIAPLFKALQQTIDEVIQMFQVNHADKS
ncbi:MAG: response regulator [Gammaproteobacteria bacterium]|nr:response regulator [Gammaproteobacteria bacterium]